ncbi:MAG: HipA domain-containing protein, partial [Verrucomicrobiota bacterium]
DHLRNHGFLLSKKVWRLSPAYDVNPNPLGLGLSLNINEDENSLDLELAKEIAEFCRIKPAKAKDIIAEVRQAVSNWMNVASDMGLSRVERDSMSPAFEQFEVHSPPSSEVQELKYWISGLGKRHNSSCRHFKPESDRGHLGTALEGSPCGLCGG